MSSAGKCRMKSSIIYRKLREKRGKSELRLWAVAVWIAVWALISSLLGEEVLLASPLSVLERWIELMRDADFWERAGYSAVRIGGGLISGALIGILLAIPSARFKWVRELLMPLISTIKTVPVASFVILALIWLGAEGLGLFIALLLSLLMFYTHTLSGIEAADKKLLEMAQVYRLSAFKRISTIYLPAVLPHLAAAAEVAVGLSWKSGTAAELIGVPRGSIGEKLYYAKVYLMSSDLLCWTLTVMLLSGLFGAVVKNLIKLWAKKYE